MPVTTFGVTSRSPRVWRLMVLYAVLLAGIARAAVWDDNARNETPDCALGCIFFFGPRTRDLRNACYIDCISGEYAEARMKSI